MAVDKNFIVRNGLEVGGALIWAQAGSGRVGINTTQFEGANIFQVAGGIGATNLTVSQSATFYNAEVNNGLILDDAVISIGGSIGGVNQYIRATGSGLAWADLPISQKFASNFTATPGQVTFAATYVVGLVDVFINGVRLTESEYVAVDGATISLLNPCFGGENIDIVGQATIGLGSTDAIQGITVLEEGVPVGAAANITSINFVGAAVTAVGLGVGVTVYIDPPLGGGSQYWDPTSPTGIHTTSSVGIGTVDPRYTLEVGAVGASGTSLWVNGDARITGILTVGESSVTIDGQNNTIGIGTGTVISETGITVGVITAISFTGSLTGAASSVTVTNSVSTTTTYYPTFTSNNGEILVDQSKLLYQPSTGELKAGSVNVSGLTSTRTLSVFSGVTGGLTITGITTINSGRLQFGTGLENVRIGYNAAPSVTGNSNIAIGDAPLSGLTTGSTNIAIGQYALDSLTGGSRNIAIGERAGRFLTGNNNVIIGKFDGNSNNLDIRTLSNNIVIADGQGNIRQYITSTGRVGFNTYNPVSDFHVIGNSTFAGVVTATTFIGDGSGLTNIVATGTGIEIRDDGSVIGTASTINFGSNISVSQINAGIVTVSTTPITTLPELSVTGIATLGSNSRVSGYFSASQLNVSTGATFGGSSSGFIEVKDSGFSNAYIAPGQITFNNVGGIQQIGTTQFFRASYDGSSLGAYYFSNYYGGFDHKVFYIDSNGATEIYYDENKKLETTSTGIVVTGVTTTNTLSVSGNSNISGNTSTNNLSVSNNVNVSGIVTANSFVGDGSQLTGISGSGGTLGVGTFYASIGVTTTIHTLSNSNVVSEYTLFFQYNSTIQSQKVMVMNNGSTAYAQEYAIMYEPSQIVSVGATVSGSNVLLQVTPKSGITGITTFKYLLQVVS